MGSASNLRIAVLIPNPPNTSFWSWLQQNFIDSFAAVAPHAQIDYFDPVEANTYPDPAQYNLILVAGGKTDASSSEPWILNMLEFIRTTVQTLPKTKMLGICWGHQAIARALGGRVGPVPGGPVAGVLPVKLTEKGREFFPFTAEKVFYIASEFHVREVAEPAPGFIALAQDNECFVSESNAILTFQAHPEINGTSAKKAMLGDDGTYTCVQTPKQLEETIARCEGPQDGLAILERVIQWVYE